MHTCMHLYWLCTYVGCMKNYSHTYSYVSYLYIAVHVGEKESSAIDMKTIIIIVLSCLLSTVLVVNLVIMTFSYCAYKRSKSYV